MEKYMPTVLVSNRSIDALYMSHYASRKKLEALTMAYEQLEKDSKYYKWLIKHPILRRLPFVRKYVKRKIGV